MMRKLARGAFWRRFMPMLLSVAVVLFVSMPTGASAHSHHDKSVMSIVSNAHQGSHAGDMAHFHCGGGSQCSILAILGVTVGDLEQPSSTVDPEEPLMRVGRHYSPLLQPPIGT